MQTTALMKVEKRLFYTFLAAVLILLASYLYLVNMSVFNIVARQQAEKEISRLETQVAGMEAEYLAATNREINVDYAKSLGFEDSTKTQNYVVVRQSNLSLVTKANDL